MAWGLTCTPVYQKALGAWRATYGVRMSFHTGSYVGAAKRFRKWADQHGLTTTLKQKAKKYPELTKFLGGKLYTAYVAYPERAERKAGLPLFNENNPKKESKAKYSYSKLIAQLKDPKALNIKQGILNIRGWIRGGYDYSHPDIFPLENPSGTPEQ